MSKKYTPLWRETRLQVKIYKTHQATQNILPKLEARIIKFLSEWLVTFLMPAKHLLDTRAPHLYFMFLKEYWFKELYLGLKITASFDFFFSVQCLHGSRQVVTRVQSQQKNEL